MKPKVVEKDILYKPQPFSKNSKTALLGILLFVMLTIIAMMTYNNYNFLGQTLSELGVGLTSILFNSGVALCGLLLIPFFISWYKKENFLSQLICYVGIATSISFILVGLITLAQPLIHTFFAGLFFVLVTMTAILALIQMVKINYNKKILYPVGAFLYLMVNVFAIGMTITYLVIQTPVWQKIAVLGIVIWLFEWIILKEN